jgi:hypothetical protein
VISDVPQSPFQRYESGFSEPRLEEGDILLDAATAYPNAGNQLALAGKQRPAAHRGVPALRHRHQWEKGLPRSCPRVPQRPSRPT